MCSQSVKHEQQSYYPKYLLLSIVSVAACGKATQSAVYTFSLREPYQQGLRTNIQDATVQYFSRQRPGNPTSVYRGCAGDGKGQRGFEPALTGTSGCLEENTATWRLGQKFWTEL
ncbi:hypothetical protein AMECASPLE_005028 [Ameca splendens]|uniref:Secreted protein n=1 Tax=Ameca splendens TaxID=208324 RepID=A0ABV0XYV1_9TELE